jgi:hypothetical protein
LVNISFLQSLVINQQTIQNQELNLLCFSLGSSFIEKRKIIQKMIHEIKELIFLDRNHIQSLKK